MIFLIASVFAFLSSLRLHTILLWTIALLMLMFSFSDVSQGWGMYHYYVGSKWFPEIGYFDLYECTIDEPTIRRDLHTYQYRNDSPDCDVFMSPAQWKTFNQDVIDSGFYPQAMIDKGYNGTPTYTAIFGALARWQIITPANAYLIDIVALVMAVFVAIYYLGWRKTAYIVIIILTYNGTLDRLWGHYAQWVWLSLLLMGVVLQENDNSFGAVLIGVSASLAIFPAFIMLKYWRNTKALILFGVSLSTFLTIGIGNGRGLDGYSEFIADMSLHSAYVKTELCCDVGLAHTITWSQNPTNDYSLCFVQWSDSCAMTYNYDYNPLVYWLLLPLVLLSPLGAMFGLLSLSVYYWLSFALVVVWYPERYTRLLLLIFAVIPFALVANFSMTAYVDWLYFFYFLALGAYHVYHSQFIKCVMAIVQSRLHTKITTRLFSQRLQG